MKYFLPIFILISSALAGGLPIFDCIGDSPWEHPIFSYLDSHSLIHFRNSCRKARELLRSPNERLAEYFDCRELLTMPPTSILYKAFTMPKGSIKLGHVLEYSMYDFHSTKDQSRIFEWISENLDSLHRNNVNLDLFGRGLVSSQTPRSFEEKIGLFKKRIELALRAENYDLVLCLARRDEAPKDMFGYFSHLHLNFLEIISSEPDISVTLIIRTFDVVSSSLELLRRVAESKGTLIK